MSKKIFWLPHLSQQSTSRDIIEDKHLFPINCIQIPCYHKDFQKIFLKSVNY